MIHGCWYGSISYSYPEALGLRVEALVPERLRAQHRVGMAHYAKLELAQMTVREARRVIEGLRPAVLDDFGLAAAVRLRIEELKGEGWQIGYEEDLGRRAPTFPGRDSALQDRPRGAHQRKQARPN